MSQLGVFGCWVLGYIEMDHASTHLCANTTNTNNTGSPASYKRYLLDGWPVPPHLSQKTYFKANWRILGS